MKNVDIKPLFPEKLNEVSAYYDTPNGRISVAWKRENGNIILKISADETFRYVPLLPLSHGCLCTDLFDGYNYLKDGRLEISNNRAERSIKSYVIDRKNFLFANTPSGATGSAVMFSLIMTALENKLDPWRYLTWLMKNSDTVKDVEELLPWNAPVDCKI